MSGKSSPLKCLIIGINVWVKLSEGENIFTPAMDSFASNPTPIDCMEILSYRQLLWRHVSRPSVVGVLVSNCRIELSRGAIMHGHVDIPESHGKMVRWLDEEIPRNRIPTLKKYLLGVARFPRWVEAKRIVPRLKMRNGEEFSYIRCVLPMMYQLVSMKKTSFPEMESSGSIVANVPGIVKD
ncbi:hypothetical protein Tco_0939481 [Tanacetum coccineum]|uniref:Uncharacterized protein n=1 Tax=Tanacetum coccineum TaxID=301880 RepID=A0ABQ5DMW9_9ASTR